jgi:hypothetical protein
MTPRIFGVIPATRSKVGVSSVPAEDLDTNPCAQGFVPALNPGPSWTVKNTIFLEGAIRRISVAAADRHVDVHEDYFRLQLNDFFNGLFAILGVTADPKAMPI